jgi:hypothetical protein
MGNFGLQEILFIVYACVPFLLCLLALVALFRTKWMTDTQMLLWVLVIIFVPVIGPILFFVFRKRLRRSANVSN